MPRPNPFEGWVLDLRAIQHCERGSEFVENAAHVRLKQFQRIDHVLACLPEDDLDEEVGMDSVGLRDGGE